MKRLEELTYNSESETSAFKKRHLLTFPFCNKLVMSDQESALIQIKT